MITNKSIKRVVFFVCFFANAAIHAYSQTGSTQSMTLQQCIDYALQYQPIVNQAQISVSIARTTNSINLSGWLPQASLNANAIHYFQLPTTLVSDSTGPIGSPGTAVHTGIVNTFIPQLAVTQTIFNPQLLYAAKAAKLNVTAAEQITDSAKIYTVSNVNKAFYSLLQTLQLVNVLKEDTSRLNRNVKDTYHQFVGGIVDETDYDEAVISLNNSYSQLLLQIDNIRPQYAVLKQAMGFPPEQDFNVSVDTAQLLQDVAFDTTQKMEYDKRIEYQQLVTARELQQRLTGYYRLAFLPTVSAFYNYFQEYEGDSYSNFFNHTYPYSDIGITFSLPLFTGFSRLESVHKAKLQEQLIDWSEVSLKSTINTQYNTALSNYKYNLANWSLQKDNVVRAKNVYRIVTLQYKQGIVAYINVIQGESYLITAETSEVTALFQLLQSKIDLEKAMGDIPYNR